MTNLNEMAVAIAEIEGGKKNLSIAQIKEVLRITLQVLKGMEMGEVSKLLARVK